MYGRQLVFGFLGFGTAELIAEKAVGTWQSDVYNYERSVLSDLIAYSAVSVYESEGMLYITFVSDVDHLQLEDEAEESES